MFLPLQVRVEAEASESNLSVSSSEVHGGCLVRLTGVIDETTEGQALVPDGAKIVIFDLEGVHRITSYGVLQWVKALKTLGANYYAYARCRPSIVRQFNMVAGFGAKGEIASLYLPYICESCDEEFETLLDLRTQYNAAKSASPPLAGCPSCGNTAEFDDIAESYLAFVEDYPRPSPPNEASRMLDALHAEVRAQPSTPPGASGPPNMSPANSQAPGNASLDGLRKLQDDLGETRSRLSKLMKGRTKA